MCSEPIAPEVQNMKHWKKLITHDNCLFETGCLPMRSIWYIGISIWALQGCYGHFQIHGWHSLWKAVCTNSTRKFLRVADRKRGIFFFDSTNRFQIWDALNMKGEQNWAKLAVANPKYQKRSVLYLHNGSRSEEKKSCIFIWRAAFLMHLNPSPHGGGAWCNPPWVFLEWPTSSWAYRLEIFVQLMGHPGKKKMTGSGQVTEL